MERLDQHVTKKKEELRTIQTKLTHVRMMRQLRKMSVYDLLTKDDPVLKEWFDPQTEFYKEFNDDPSLP